MAATILLVQHPGPPPVRTLTAHLAVPGVLLVQHPGPVPGRMLVQHGAGPSRMLVQHPDVVVPTGSALAYACNADGSGATLSLSLVCDTEPVAQVRGLAGDQPVSVTYSGGVAAISAVVTGDDVYTVLVQNASGVLFNSSVAVLCAAYKCFRKENRTVAVPGQVTPRWREMLGRLTVIPPMAAVNNIEGARAHIAKLALLCADNCDCSC